jgi:hypothetical protein
MTDYLAPAKKYAPHTDEKKVAAIVKHRGIALRNRGFVAGFGQRSQGIENGARELAQEKAGPVRRCGAGRGHQARDDDDEGDHDKSRVVVYYLLAEHFKKLDVLG